ncbi:MAG: 23S rRNA (adenine(2030)-N(6))-methyltransferase RlmJ [Candidatus Competibacteraceae bacterium]|nr:23S rRNA (adenine(2030)-N(6))-methyltransferase RlmJ [Candidatus Competibacteraceae bacterium]
MLGYRHGFHAGHWSDVFKHAILVQLLRALLRKDKPFFVLDTHAGAGLYDLDSPQARKTGQWREGIGRLWGQTGLSPALADYLAQVQSFNGDKLGRYPGSPRLIRQLMRQQDRLALTELHPGEFPYLKQEFAADSQVMVHRRDGYEALKALLPPPVRRGLVLIDPAYEGGGEFDRLVEGLSVIHRRWPQAAVAVWYPILERGPSARFLSRVAKLQVGEALCAELGLHPYDSVLGINGCGMMLVNPPWQLDAALEPLLPELLERLRSGARGTIRLEWLTCNR